MDADSDGGLSLDEIRSTLEKAGLGKASSTSAAANQDFLTSAFGKLDGNGDGKLDTSELTSALEDMMKSHHGHRHGPPPPPAMQATAGAADSSTAASTGLVAGATTSGG